MIVLKLLCLLLVAHGMPVLAGKWLKCRWMHPVDGGHCFLDGRRWLGGSKTWRGVASSIAGCILLGPLLGLEIAFCFAFGCWAMLGDVTSSFVKRRRGLPDSARATGLDQIPESFLPVIAGLSWLDYDWTQAVAAAVLFVALDILLSPLLQKLRIRREPY